MHVSFKDTECVWQFPLTQRVPLLGKFAQPLSRPFSINTFHVLTLFAAANVSQVSPG